MTKLKIYEYKGCSTCRNALKFLDQKGVAYDKVAIRETPPSVPELKTMLKHVGDLKLLFNVSGGDYREMNLKDKLPTMKPDEAFALLSSNGNLVKRPFVLGNGFGLVGFKEDAWKKQFAS